jgi:Na+-transporting NADH:ubiquinone oxidoreductase subunit NqrB
MKQIDKFLNGITMYRLVLYYLMGLWAIAFIFSFAGLMPFSAGMMLVALAILFASGWITNKLFAAVFRVPANVESIYITVFILALILTPPQLSDTWGLIALFWISAIAMASKYILAIRKKHIFNPAALAVGVTSLAIGASASWWIGGSLPLFIFVVSGGILIVRKILRTDLVLSFIGGAFISLLGVSAARGGNLGTTLNQAVFHSALSFFAFIMITEPLTTPPTRRLRIFYGALVGLLFAPAIHVGSIYSTPELALLVGNIFSYAVSPKKRLILSLKERKCRLRKIPMTSCSARIRNFASNRGNIWNGPWVMPRPDTRGNRRYFTIASSPTEQELVMGVKFHPESSSYTKSRCSQCGPEIR